jgi:hypothetical protein
MKIFSSSLVVRKMQIKKTLGYYFIPEFLNLGMTDILDIIICCGGGLAC